MMYDGTQINGSLISTADLVAELDRRGGCPVKCPTVDETSTAPVCLPVIPTAPLVNELCSREGVECAMIECDDGPAMTIVVHNYPTTNTNIVNHPSANLQDCEDRKCPLLDGIVCRATNNDSCPPIVVRGDES